MSRVDYGTPFREESHGLLVRRGGMMPVALEGAGNAEDRMAGAMRRFTAIGHAEHDGIIARDEVLVRKESAGFDLRADFVVQRLGWPLPLAVLIQTQGRSGSADTKLGGKMDALRDRCHIPYAFLLGGKQFVRDDKVANWLENRLALGQDRMFTSLILGLDGLMEWLVRDGATWPGGVAVATAGGFLPFGAA